MLLKFLVILDSRFFSCKVADKKWDKQHKEGWKMFVRKNAFNLYKNKNQQRPIFELKKDTVGRYAVNKHDNLPIVLRNVYSKATKSYVETKEVVYDEVLNLVLDEMHKGKSVNGSDTCLPGGINALSKRFNDQFYYKGSYRVIRKFLKDCKTCKINESLPMTQQAPPKPIRSYGPHDRIQYDLIDMAPSKRRSFMQLNPWGFRYILSIKWCFSKFCWLFPTKEKSAPQIHRIAKFLFDIEGPPTILQSDNGKEFVNCLIRRLSDDYGFRLIRGKPYTPQHQGQVERLNRTVKVYMRKLLQNCTKEQQGKYWPLLLPGIANKINKSYHFTIDDIPFRIYRNRDPNSMSSSIIPDDEVFSNAFPSAETVDADSAEFENNDDDDDGVFMDCSSVEDNPEDPSLAYDEVGTTIDNPDPLPSYKELLQSCLGSSYASSTLSSDNSTDLQDSLNQSPGPVSNEEEFSCESFNASLFYLTQKKLSSSLNALESSENMMHRNIERALKHCSGEKFSVEDKVLIRNPKISAKGRISSRDPFAPLNVVGEVLEVLPGGMYKLKLPDGDSHFQKDFFEGEMILFERHPEGESNSVGERHVEPALSNNRKSILDAITDFSFQLRRKYYKSNKKRSKKNAHISCKLFEKLFDILDCGLLAELYTGKDKQKQQELMTLFTNGLADLEKAGFTYFMYGSLAWERKRKVWLSDPLLSFLGEGQDHKCVDCFNDSSMRCKHPCCQQLALNFAERCGALSAFKKTSTMKTIHKSKTRKRNLEKESSNRSEPKKTKVDTSCCQPSHSDLLSRAHRKCLNLTENSSYDMETNGLIKEFQAKLVTFSDVPAVQRNLRYFLEVAFQDFPQELMRHISRERYQLSSHVFEIELQGSTLLCGMCALNNLLGTQIFNPTRMNFIADCLWLKQALLSDFRHDLSQCSLVGNYNIDVLTCSLKQEKYIVRHLHNQIMNFFVQCSPEEIDKNPQNLFSSLLRHLSISPGDRVLCNSASHYTVLHFTEHSMFILDSINGLSYCNASDAVVHLWQRTYDNQFSLLTVQRNEIIILDDNEQTENSTRDHSVFEIMKFNSKVDENQEISDIYPYVTAHDLRTLESTKFINDSVIKAVCQAINKVHNNVFAVDPLIVQKLICNPDFRFCNRKDKPVLPRKECLLFPMNTNKHWWVLSVNMGTEEYLSLDSLGLSHREEVAQILKAITSNIRERNFEFKETFVDFSKQGTNTTQCGAFAVCFLTSMAAKTEVDFSLYDMDHVRDRLAWCIVNNKEHEIAKGRIWKGELHASEQ